MANPYVAAVGLAVDVVGKLVQDRSEEAFGNLNPSATAGDPIEVTIPSGGTTTVPHGLGIVPSNGYTIVCKMGQGDVWDYQPPDDKFLYLQTSAAADLTIRVVVS